MSSPHCYSLMDNPTYRGVFRPLPQLRSIAPIQSTGTNTNHGDSTNPQQTLQRQPFLQAHLLQRLVVPPGTERWLAYTTSLLLQPCVIGDRSILHVGQFEVDHHVRQRMCVPEKDKFGAPPQWNISAAHDTFIRVRAVECASLPLLSHVSFIRAPTAWPPDIALLVNGKAVELRRKFHHDADMAADLGEHVVLGSNILEVAVLANYQFKRLYAIGVEELRFTALSDLVSMIRSNIQSKEETFVNIQRRFMGANSDVTIATESIQVGILDPMTRRRIEEPVRGVDCTHLECFDLLAFLESLISHRIVIPSWRCPICGGDVRPTSMRFIVWMQEVLEQLQGKALQARTVLVDPSGAWQCGPDHSTTSNEVIVID